MLPDPVPVRLTVALLVNQTCNAARDRRRDMQTKSHLDLQVFKAQQTPKEALREGSSEQKTSNGSGAAVETDNRRRSVSAPRPAVGGRQKSERVAQRTKTDRQVSPPPVPVHRRSASATRKPPRQPPRPSPVKKTASGVRESKDSSRQSIIELLDRALQSSDTVIESLSTQLQAIRHTDSGGEDREPAAATGQAIEKDTTTHSAPDPTRNAFTEVDNKHPSQALPVAVAVASSNKPLPPPKPKKPSSFIAKVDSKDNEKDSPSTTKKYINPFEA